MSEIEIPQNNKVMLVILDGLGAAPASRGNAVSLANPSNLIKYWASYPHTYLDASGEAVGLPKGIYGNSEVGHLNIGAGKTILQNLPRINKSIETGRYFTNATLEQALAHANKNNSRIHIMGLLSDGAVHSHISHFEATLKYFQRKHFDGKVYLHTFTDGRDTLPTNAKQYFTRMQALISELNYGHIASIVGRAYAMDRNHKWERTQKAYDLIVKGKGKVVKDWEEGIAKAYQADEIDEYIEPVTIPDGDQIAIIQNNDVVLFMNFRADRALQITDAILDSEFNEFPTQPLSNLFYAGMVPYRRNYPEHQIFPKEYLKLSIGRVMAEAEKRQLRISESEKFPHVTYFFNGGLPIKYHGEDRIEVPSPNVPTYDLQPEMSIQQVSESLIERIKLDIYDFIVLNLANPDMVGHTGNLSACVEAVKAVDYYMGKIVPEFLARGGTVLITADHGNVEEVIKLDTGEVDTEHSLNPVPFIIVDDRLSKTELKYGELSDIAPTILELMGLAQPGEMSGQSLLK